MLVLGIETSCDDTSASVVDDGARLLSSVVSSQDSIHFKYGGIVPELASRRHIEAVVPVVDEALLKAGVGLSDIGAIAVTKGPGLVGSILVGLSFAKAVSLSMDIPFVGVNHVLAHPFAVFVDEGKGAFDPPEYPFVSLVVSGGHTTLMRFDSFDSYVVLGETLDDAAGEAFDKVAKALGLGYPGGAIIDALAKKGDPSALKFTRPMMYGESLDFSFSGLKTAVTTHIKAVGAPSEAGLVDLAASFQEAVVDVLVAKALRAVEGSATRSLVVAGGVACNSRLRERLKEASGKKGVRLHLPSARLCTDNAAFIAALGFRFIEKGTRDNVGLNAEPGLEGF